MMKKVCRWLLLLSILISASTINNVYAKELIALDQALKKIYKSAQDFQKETHVLTLEQISSIEAQAKISFDQTHASEIIMYTPRLGNNPIGTVFEDTVIGKWGPIHYLLALKPDGSIQEVVILDYQEIRGRPISKKRFLRQYKQKSIKDPLKLRKDIDGVTGATISSRSLTDGIRKLLYVYKELNKK